MQPGELFLIDNLSLSPRAGVLWAAERYRRQYGQAPTLCLVHPSVLPKLRGRLMGLEVQAKPTLLPNYVWLGAVAETTPLAR